jgi:hypothetical protein
VRVDDRGDQVAAEGRPDLEEQVLVGLVFLLDVVVADLEIRAVGRQAAAQGAGDARGEVAAVWRAADQEDLRLALLDLLDRDAGVGESPVQGQLFVVGEDDAVGAVGDDVLRQRVDVVAAQEADDFDAELVRQLAGLADQLEADFGDLAVGVLDEYPDVLWSDMSGLPDDVFVDQLRNHRRDSFGVGGDGLALRALEDHEVDLVNLGRGAGQADAAFGRADVLGGPDGDLQIVLGEVGVERLVRLEVRPLRPDGGVLARDGGELALHLAADVRRSGRVGRVDDGQQARERAAHDLGAVVQRPLDGDLVS